MKQLSYILFALSILYGCAKGDDVEESRWTKLNASTTSELTDIYFSSNEFGVACGSFGTLLKTEDAGKTWQHVDVGVGYSFSTVFALNEQEFYTSRVGLYKTINSGLDFHEAGDIGGIGSRISGIHFFHSQHGIICKGATIYMTGDGGNQWTPVYPFEGYASMLEITDNNIVYLAGGRTYDSITEGEMHNSFDNGASWVLINLPQEIAGSEITAMDFINSQTGYISTFENKIFQTVDGGKNWIKKAELSFGPIYDLCFISENIGCLLSKNKIYMTNDGGAEWRTEYQAESTNYFTAVNSTPDGSIYAAGQGGMILKRD